MATLDPRLSDAAVETAASALPRAEIDRLVGYWGRGHENIQACLTKAASGDWHDAPMPLHGKDAELWLRAQAEAYRHAIEMMGLPEGYGLPIPPAPAKA